MTWLLVALGAVLVLLGLNLAVRWWLRRSYRGVGE